MGYFSLIILTGILTVVNTPVPSSENELISFGIVVFFLSEIVLFVFTHQQRECSKISQFQNCPFERLKSNNHKIKSQK